MKTLFTAMISAAGVVVGAGVSFGQAPGYPGMPPQGMGGYGMGQYGPGGPQGMPGMGAYGPQGMGPGGPQGMPGGGGGTDGRYGLSPYGWGSPQEAGPQGMGQYGPGGPGMAMGPYGQGAPGMPPMGAPNVPASDRYGALPVVKRFFRSDTPASTYGGAYGAIGSGGSGGGGPGCDSCGKKEPSHPNWFNNTLNGHPIPVRQYQPEQVQQGTLVFPNHPYVRSPRDYFMYGQEK